MTRALLERVEPDAPISPRDESWMLIHDLYWLLDQSRNGRRRRWAAVADIHGALVERGYDPYADYKFSAATKDGFIYVVRFQRFVKIGFSRNPDARLAVIRAHLPDDVEVVRIQRGNEVDERFVHRAFSHCRQHHDWFREEDTLADWIKEDCKL